MKKRKKPSGKVKKPIHKKKENPKNLNRWFYNPSIVKNKRLQISRILTSNTRQREGYSKALIRLIRAQGERKIKKKRKRDFWSIFEVFEKSIKQSIYFFRAVKFMYALLLLITTKTEIGTRKKTEKFLHYRFIREREQKLMG